MQNIQDKDLDKLFKDKLADSAVEPPASLWANIEQQIQPKPKKVLPVYWMAAALAFVAIAAGLLFNKTEKIQLYGPAIANVGENTLPEVTDEAATEIEGTSMHQPADTKAGAVSLSGDVVKSTVLLRKPGAKKELIAMQPSRPKVHLQVISPIKTGKPEETDAVIALPESSAESLIAQVNPTHPVTETAIVEEHQEHNGSSTERNGIKNVGDLVNFVVDKVDKREKKFLQFNTDDDDNSSVVAINIGIIKFNAKNKSRR